MNTLGANCAIGYPAEPCDLRIARIDAGHLSLFQRVVAEQEDGVDLGLLTLLYAGLTLRETCDLPKGMRSIAMLVSDLPSGMLSILLLHGFKVVTF